MKKQITFQSDYDNVEDKAILWLQNLSKCFHIKSAKITRFIVKKPYCKDYKCRLEVTYD